MVELPDEGPDGSDLDSASEVPRAGTGSPKRNRSSMLVLSKRVLRSGRLCVAVIVVFWVVTCLAALAYGSVGFDFVVGASVIGLAVGIWAVVLIATTVFSLLSGHTENWRARLLVWMVPIVVTALAGQALNAEWPRRVRFAVQKDSFDRTFTEIRKRCEAEASANVGVPDYPLAASTAGIDAPVQMTDVRCRGKGVQFASGNFPGFLVSTDWGFAKGCDPADDDSLPQSRTVKVTRLSGGWVLWRITSGFELD